VSIKAYRDQSTAVSSLKSLKYYFTRIEKIASSLLELEVFDKTLMYIQDDIDDVDRLTEMCDFSSSMLEDIKLLMSKFYRVDNFELEDDSGHFLHLAEAYKRAEEEEF